MQNEEKSAKAKVGSVLCALQNWAAADWQSAKQQAGSLRYNHLRARGRTHSLHEPNEAGE